MPKIKLLEARVLVAIEGLGVNCSHVISGTEEHIAALAKAGLVDPAESAVAYAKSIGAEVVQVAKEVVDELVAAVGADQADAGAGAKASTNESAAGAGATTHAPGDSQ